MAKAMLCRLAQTTEVTQFGAGWDAMRWCDYLIVYQGLQHYHNIIFSDTLPVALSQADACGEFSEPNRHNVCCVPQ